VIAWSVCKSLSCRYRDHEESHRISTVFAGFERLLGEAETLDLLKYWPASSGVTLNAAWPVTVWSVRLVAVNTAVSTFPTLAVSGAGGVTFQAIEESMLVRSAPTFAGQ